MNMARVMFLTLRDAENMQENLFDVFVPGRDQRIPCRKLLKTKNLNIKKWLRSSSLSSKPETAVNLLMHNVPKWSVTVKNTVRHSLQNLFQDF